MFNKKLTVEINYPIDEETIKNSIKTIPENFPKYFKTIPKKQFSLSFKRFIPFLKTIKSCPGFINICKRSILITAPSDAYALFDKNQILTQRTGLSSFTTFSVQENDQLLSYVPNKDYKFIVKYMFPYRFKTNFSYLINQASYHFPNIQILPGIIDSTYNDTLSFFIFIKKDQDELYIKQGDVLGLITPLCENKLKLKFKRKKPEEYNQLFTFDNTKKFILKKLF